MNGGSVNGGRVKHSTARDHRTSVIVAALASGFGVVLLLVTGALGQSLSEDPFVRDSGSGSLLISIVAFVFLVIAVYVGAVVTTNTVATVIAGRTRTIALLRLIGSSARAQRRAVAFEGLRSGILGSALGLVVGVGVAWLLVRLSIATGFAPEFRYDVVSPTIILPFAMVVLTTWGASWVGTRRVLDVTPLQAVSAAEEHRRENSASHNVRNTFAVILFVIGGLILALGVVVGMWTPLGVLVGLVGGILSFTGVVLGAELVMPPALRLVGRMFGRGPTASLASANAVRYPERSTRTTVGLVIAVTLVTTFVVTMETFRTLALAAETESPDSYIGMQEALSIAIGVFSILIGFAAVIAAVGMINNLSLSVVQRQRELGLLRALGFTSSQVRRMIIVEAVQMSVAAVAVGLALGIGYGWVGAQSLLASFNGLPELVPPTIPWGLVGVLALAAAALALIASVAPSRRATRVSPVAALAQS